MGKKWLGGAALLIILTGCDHGDRRLGRPLPEPGPMAVAVLHDARGVEVGRATAQDVQEALRVTVEVHSLPPGVHGVHVHGVGRCDPPEFASAGGHWNPLGTRHGTLNPAGAHMGDLPNLDVGTDGRATLAVNLPGGGC